jgi:hypothetical protein
MRSILLPALAALVVAGCATVRPALEVRLVECAPVNHVVPAGDCPEERLRPVHRADVTLILRDANGEDVARNDMRTNVDGVAVFDFMVSQGGMGASVPLDPDLTYVLTTHPPEYYSYSVDISPEGTKGFFMMVVENKEFLQIDDDTGGVQYEAKELWSTTPRRGG